MTSPAAHPPHHVHHGHGPAPEHLTGLADILDLDATLGAEVLVAALDAAAAALGTAPRDVVDLGAGTGTGTVAIARRFPDARVHSIDASPAMLERLRAATAAAGVGDRVEAHLADLDGDWPAVLPGTLDLAWAALSLHHVSDPAEVLRQVFALLRPGGVLVVTEMTGETTYEPADLGTGRDGLGERLVGALAAAGYPATGEWTAALETAGFAPVQRRRTALTASARTPDGARYLALELERHQARLTESLDPGDHAAVDSAVAALRAGTSGLALTSGRAVWIATRGDASAPPGRA